MEAKGLLQDSQKPITGSNFEWKNPFRSTEEIIINLDVQYFGKYMMIDDSSWTKYQKPFTAFVHLLTSLHSHSYLLLLLPDTYILKYFQHRKMYLLHNCKRVLSFLLLASLVPLQHSILLMYHCYQSILDVVISILGANVVKHSCLVRMPPYNTGSMKGLHVRRSYWALVHMDVLSPWVVQMIAA
jgi:hypothetical protein